MPGEGLFALLRPIYISLGTLSLLCGVLVFVAFLKSVFRPSRAAENMTPAEKQLWVFIASMSVCDAILSIKFLVPALLDHLTDNPNTEECLMEALIGQFFAIAGVLWYAAVVMCLILELTGKASKMVSLRISAPIGVWGYSLVATVFVWSMDGFGPSADGTCWITSNWYRLTFFVPVWLAMMLGFILLVCALCNCNALGRRLPCYSLTRSILFMAAFVFVWIWVVVLRIYEAVVPPGQEPPPQLILLHACGVSSQGLVNFLLWVTSPSLAAVLTPPAFCKRLRCCGVSELSQPLRATSHHAVNSLSVQADLVHYDPRLNPDERPSFGAELTPRTHEELLMLAEETVDFPSSIADYRGLSD